MAKRRRAPAGLRRSFKPMHPKPSNIPSCRLRHSCRSDDTRAELRRGCKRATDVCDSHALNRLAVTCDKREVVASGADGHIRNSGQLRVALKHTECERTASVLNVEYQKIDEPI